MNKKELYENIMQSVAKEVKKALNEGGFFELSSERRSMMFSEICKFFYNGGRGFTFEYTSPWGETSEVKLGGRDMIKLIFEDPEENILLEDCDDHLMNALYRAIKNA